MRLPSLVLTIQPICQPKTIIQYCICSFHLDHAGGLPWFLQKTPFKGRVFMTHATKAVYRWLLSDYIKVR